MHWALIGPGAVGLYYGGRLAASGAKLSVLARSDADALSAHGIRIAMVNPKTGAVDDRLIGPLEAVHCSADTIGAVDCVIVAAKSTVNAALIESLRAVVEPAKTTIVCLQNGMGNAEFFAKTFPDNPILVGLCFVCVNRTEAGLVENYHPGKIELGSLGDRWPDQVESVADALNAASVPTDRADRLDAALWRKLCWNVPFNGLSIAAGGITTDKILSDRTLVKRAHMLMEEVRSAASATGILISDTFIEGQFTVTERMGAYKPSSLIDYLAQKPVELESIWGEPLRRGESLGAKMPELNKLYAELKALL